MDYEWRIKLAERELAHLKEMQALQRAHLDAHDQSLEIISGRFDCIENNMEKLSAGLVQLNAAQLITEQKLQNLIEIPAHAHSNGKLQS